MNYAKPQTGKLHYRGTCIICLVMFSCDGKHFSRGLAKFIAEASRTEHITTTIYRRFFVTSNRKQSIFILM
ncbi:hypothetical protein Hanom_Chr04g00296581 [Helianthus anomalus]